MNDYLGRKMSDHFFAGFDKDGNRIFSIKMGLTDSLPMRQRYDKYIGLLGQVQDLKFALKQMWDQYSMHIRRKQMGFKPQGEQDFDNETGIES